MSLLSAHRGELNGSRSRPRSAVARKVIVLFKTMHRAIIAAKLRRLRNELMLHRRATGHAEFDDAKFPQPPAILGEKWDS